MKCSHCGQEHPDGFQFCPVTGKQISLLNACSNEKCINFGKYVLPPDAKFCPECGRPVHSSSFCANLENGHEYVDLGLSVKWATCNVGARRPEEFGDLFAWGETSPKDTYEWSNLKYCNDNVGKSFSKYNEERLPGIFLGGIIDNLTNLDLFDDAAYVNWGVPWRLPTYEEFEELINICNWVWYGKDNTEFHGISGFKVTSRNLKYINNFIFFPSATESPEDEITQYWTSRLTPYSSDHAETVAMGDPQPLTFEEERCTGLYVRPVFR